ncbi:MAG: glycosyltransferase family 2 protein [Pirellulaceae bacterium]|nr:glycosyltransferase family 2 protein [Pirellulaceae bacterium]
MLIVTRNRCPAAIDAMNPLAWLFDSLSQQENVTIGRVVVVNDGSTDFTLDVIRRYQDRLGAELLLVSDGRRRGSSQARNLGLRHCTADLVFLCDDDCQLTRHALGGLHQTYLLQKRRDPACAAVHLAFYQRAVRPEKLVASRQIGMVDERRGVFQTHLRSFPREYAHRPRWLDRQSALLAPLPIRHLCGVFLAERRAIAECGFPEDFPWANAFCEELELSLRLLARGRTLYHQPDPKFFALHYKAGWQDPAGPATVPAEGEFRCFGSVGRLNSRILAADQPRLDSGNRVDLETWCYSKLISYLVCLGRRSRPGGLRWMKRGWRAFVRDNSDQFYGHSSTKIESSVERARLWQAALRDGLRFLAKQDPRSAPTCGT